MNNDYNYHDNHSNYYDNHENTTSGNEFVENIDYDKTITVHKKPECDYGGYGYNYDDYYDYSGYYHDNNCSYNGSYHGDLDFEHKSFLYEGFEVYLGNTRYFHNAFQYSGDNGASAQEAAQCYSYGSCCHSNISLNDWAGYTPNIYLHVFLLRAGRREQQGHLCSGQTLV